MCFLALSIAPTGFTVAAGSGTETFELTYTVTTAGPFSATLTITSDDADKGSYEFTISGIGEDSDLTVPVELESFEILSRELSYTGEGLPGCADSGTASR